MERATEIEWLGWFYGAADFGPADDDVRAMMREQFKQETGKDIPEEYEED